MARRTRQAPNQSSAGAKRGHADSPPPGLQRHAPDARSPEETRLHRAGAVGRGGRRLVGARVVEADRLVVFGERAGIEKGALDLEQLGKAGQLEEAEHADRVALVRLREVVEGGDAVAAQPGQEIEHHHLRDLRDGDIVDRDAEVAELAFRQRRVDADVELDERFRKSLAHGADFLARLQRGDHQHVDAGRKIGLAAAQHLVDAAADGGARIGARQDDDVGIELVAHGDRRPQLADGFLRRDDLQALGEAAALRKDLVLDEEACDAGVDQLADRARRVKDIAEAGLAIGEDRDRHGPADVARIVDHLGHGHQAGIGQAEDMRRGLRSGQAE